MNHKGTLILNPRISTTRLVVFFLSAMVIPGVGFGQPVECTDDPFNVLQSENCGFDSGIDGWSVIVGVNATPNSVEGNPTPGSFQIESVVPDDEGDMETMVSSSCVNITPSTAYQIESQFKLTDPFVQVTCGFGGTVYSEANCAGSASELGEDLGENNDYEFEFSGFEWTTASIVWVSGSNDFSMNVNAWCYVDPWDPPFTLLMDNFIATTDISSINGAGENSFRGDSYGNHVASDNDWLIVGAPREDVDADDDGMDSAQGDINRGAVYIYRRTDPGLMLHQKLIGIGDSMIVGDRFGAGVDIAGDWLLVGSSGNNNFPGFVDPNPDPSFGPFYFAGKVYVFRYNGDTELWEGPVQELTSDVPTSGDSFGARTESTHITFLDVKEKDKKKDKKKDKTVKLLAIGEPNNFAINEPKLHIFKLTGGTWVRVQIIPSPSGRSDTFFSDKLVQTDKYLLVTESRFDPDLDTPKVHIYELNPEGVVPDELGDLVPLQTLDAPSGVHDYSICNGSFGGGLSAGGGVAAIGDPCDGDVGSVQVYAIDNRNTNPLSLIQTLPNPAPAAGTFYGTVFSLGRQSIATNGDTIVVGTNSFGVPDPDVQIYSRAGDGSYSAPTALASPRPGDPFNGAGWGQSVHLTQDGQLMIGQMGWLWQWRGRLFIFDLP
jgi:hypothetical protein